MKGTLKVISVWLIIIGIAAIAFSVLAFAGVAFMAPAVETGGEKLLMGYLSAEGIVNVVSGIFNLALGVNGIKGVNGNQASLANAVKLGWVALVVAVINAVMQLIGNVHIGTVLVAVIGLIAPLLYLVYAKKLEK